MKNKDFNDRWTVIADHKLDARHLAGLIVTLVCLCFPVSSSFAQSSSPEPDLSGGAFFDFAFRDNAQIVQRGAIGGDKEAILAQKAQAEAQKAQEAQYPENEVQTSEPNSDNSASVGQGLGAETMESPAPTKLTPGQSYRIADLILNCDIEFCQNPDNIEALLRATGLELGHLASQEDLALSIERLRKTGYFSNIHQHLKYAGDRIEVSFDTIPHTRIRHVIVDKSGALYDAEVKKRMILRPGGTLYPRTALLRGKNVDDIPKETLIQMALEDQINSLTRVYTKEGYFDAEVQIIPKEIEPNLVDLHVQVEHAESYVLGKIYVRGNHVRTYADIEDAFRSEFSFFGGVTKAEIEDAVQTILQTYRNNGYYQTKIDFVSRRNSERKTIDVFLDITESPHWVIEIDGNQALPEAELLEKVTFQSSGYVDRGEVEASAIALKNAYISAGYYWAQVTGEQIRSGTGQSNVVIFHVNEGTHAEIGEIAFDGAFSMSREELLDVISSKEYSTFGSGAYPQRSMIADDAAKIVDAYRERGFLNADVPNWSLEPIEQSGRFRLTFIIREGKRSHFVHRQIRYTDRESYESYDVLIDQPQNDIFSDYAFRAERAAITKQLRARGHATISDRVRCTSYYEDGSVASEETCEIAEYAAACMPDDLESLCVLEETPHGMAERCQRHYKTEFGIEGEPECKLKNGVTGHEVDVEYEVTLGPKYSFGDVFVHGNVVTRDWVVDQDIPFVTGETFDFNKVIDARGLLRRRTIYKTASLNIIGVDDGLVSETAGDSTSTTERPVPLVINVEEGERRWLDFALGLSLNGGDWILTGEMEFVEANLLGTGWDLRLLVMPEARIYENEFVFTQKFNQNFFTLLTLSIPVMPASGFNIVTQLFYDLRYIPETNKEEYGWLVELQWNINKALFAALAFELESSRASSFGVDVDANIDKYDACYPVAFTGEGNGTWTCPFSNANETFTVSMTPRLSYDGRDNPLTPKYGFYAEGKVKLAYSNSEGWYVKPEARASYMYTFLEHFTMAFNLRFGVSFLEEGSKLPLVDRYFLGGLNMRGYDNEALGPRLVNDLTPNVATNEAGGGEVLFNLTAELRFPIWTSVGIYGALFVDMGALMPHQPTYYSPGSFAEELFVNQMRYTAGLGLRCLISEAIPPIVLDYGFILNRRRGDPLGGFNINIGYTF